jgi:RNA polymerase sigma factor (sigma-70 family)
MENLPHKSEADACGPGPLAPTFGQQGDATPDGRERPDDETLVQRFQSGQITLEALCNHLRARYAERLLRYAECPSGGGVKRAADEAVHDTFQAFLLLAPYFKVKGGGCVGRCLYRILINRCHEWFRFIKRSGRELPEDVESGNEKWSDFGKQAWRESIEKELGQALGDALDALCEDQRTVVKLKLTGMSFDEIAEKLSIPRSTASERYYVAIPHIQTYMMARGYKSPW